MSPSITSTTQNPVTNSSGQPKAPVTDPLANESTFLTLLVSQLKNQDPLNPTDSNQFVSQLTSYSQLEQLIGINKNTTGISQTTTTPATNQTTTP
jgi:flagellar basal-body rod modification protein FlgD